MPKLILRSLRPVDEAPNYRDTVQTSASTASIPKLAPNDMWGLGMLIYHVRTRVRMLSSVELAESDVKKREV